jgi:hypothetical protein
MMDSMQSHARMSTRMTADEVAAMLPMHRQMVASMLGRMTSESRAMHLPANAAYTALADSVRRDLSRLSGMKKDELKAAMPAHCARVMRLMRIHKNRMAAGDPSHR